MHIKINALQLIAHSLWYVLSCGGNGAIIDSLLQ